MLKAWTLGCAVTLLVCTTAGAQDWTKSKWGPTDEIGAANYMKPELVLKAAQLVKTGKTYALGIPVGADMPAYPPRGFKITVVQPGQAGNPGLGPNKATYNDDMLKAGSASAARWTALATSASNTSTTTATSSPISPIPTG